jgi:hypothetical protein
LGLGAWLAHGGSAHSAPRRAARTVGLWASGGRVGRAVRLAWLADNQIGDEGAAALAAALPQMASLTMLDLRGTSTPAALGLRLWGLGHGLLTAVVCAVCLGVRAHGRLWAAGGRVGRGSEACVARREPDRRRGRGGAGGGAAADGEPLNAASLPYVHGCGFWASSLGLGAWLAHGGSVRSVPRRAGARSVCGRRAVGSEGQ